MTAPPTRPEPWDPRDADPLTVSQWPIYPPAPQDQPHSWMDPCGTLEGTDHCWFCYQPRADRRHDADPLDAAEQEEARWRFFHPEEGDYEPDRRSCLSVLGFLVLFWAAVLLAVVGWGR